MLDDGEGLARRESAHANVVLLAARRRDRVDAGRVGQHFVLAHEPRGRAVRDHETRVEAGVMRQESR